jgi:hypothetical protein
MSDDRRMNGSGQVAVDSSRHVELEREWTIDAARTVAAARPDALIRLAELRARGDVVRERESSNFGHNVLQELADARNHLVWWLEQITHAPGGDGELAGELTTHIASALAAVTLAYQHADAAQALMVDWRRSQQ